MSNAQKQAYKILITLREPVYIEHIIGPYICDFVLQNRLAVLEIDGYTHDDAEAYDYERDRYLLKAGFDVYRIAVKDISEKTIGELLDRIPFVGRLQVNIHLALAKDRRERGEI